jgi:hypothetical protein
MFGVLQLLPVPEKPWEDFSMDFIIALLECESFEAIWVVVDRLSKMRHFIPCDMMTDAIGLAWLFLWEVEHLHGVPVTIVLDWGSQSACTFWGQICSRLEINQ